MSEEFEVGQQVLVSHDSISDAIESLTNTNELDIKQGIFFNGEIFFMGRFCNIQIFAHGNKGSGKSPHIGGGKGSPFFYGVVEHGQGSG